MKKLFALLAILTILTSTCIACYPRNIVETSLLFEADLTRKDIAQTDTQVMTAIQSTIEKRLHTYGISSPEIQILGSNRISVGIPKVNDIDVVINLIVQEGILSFKEQKLDDRGYTVKDASGNVIWLPAMALGSDGVTQKELTSKYLKPNAFVSHNSLGQPEVAFEWNTEGAKLFGEVTQRDLNKPLGIFFNNVLVYAPTVYAVITEKGVITGITLDVAKTMVAQLNSGSLAAPLTFITKTPITQ